MRRLTLLSVGLVRQAVKSAGDSADVWAANLPALTRSISTLQEYGAWGGLYGNAAALAQQGTYVAPDWWAVPRSFAGTTNTGRYALPLGPALTQTWTRFQKGLETRIWSDTQVTQWWDKIGHGLVENAARDAVGVDVITRPRVRYVRMITHDSNSGPCQFCIMLAGQLYWVDHFDAHPDCCCKHIPVAENVGGSMATDPYEYFKGLVGACGHSETCTCEQDRVFSKARAQAIRDGGDIYQVTNTTLRAQRFPRDYAPGSPFREAYDARRTASDGYRYTDRQSTGGGFNRLTPKGIYEIAGGSHDEALRLLRDQGYILERDQQLITRDHPSAYRVGGPYDYRPTPTPPAPPLTGYPAGTAMGDIHEAAARARSNAANVAYQEMRARAQDIR